ncbi:MAG: hypothetical protein KAI69_05530, partial [Deltaproteobacteria bacterium]|nr:hypothetical protein [Deltaproteobacteria bacterium]
RYFLRRYQSCISSKGKKDLLDWLEQKGEFPALFLLRRYLKIVINFCEENDLMEMETKGDFDLPFSINKIPIKYPSPAKMTMYYDKKPGSHLVKAGQPIRSSLHSRSIRYYTPK